MMLLGSLVDSITAEILIYLFHLFGIFIALPLNADRIVLPGVSGAWLF
jgi:hypothetical protein